MVVNDNALSLTPRGDLGFIASYRASTGCSYTKNQSTGPYKSGVRVALSEFRVKEKPPRQSPDRLDLETVLKRLPYRAGP
ncbi:hypothetical protein PS838_05511 [Pseudomonas fluorescens]|nr:hypothetical protein PS838_05511 [Pseudomonas fluorescens]